MAASENVDTIIEALQSPQLEGFKSKLYIPQGCFETTGNKRVYLNDLKAEFGKSNSAVKGEKKPEWPGLETACKSDPLKSWKVIGTSGFTIATGFDISQQGVHDIKKFHFSKGLETKLLPFAKDYSGPAPTENPAFSNIELKEIDQKVVTKKISVLAEKYNEQTKGKKFDELDVQYQTVLYSMYHQYAANLFNSNYTINKVWKKAIGNDWNGVQTELSGLNDGYSSRRKKEAELIGEAIKAEELSASAVKDVQGKADKI